MDYNKKRPKNSSNPSPQKKSLANVSVSNDAEKIFWSFALVDREGEWGFNKIDKNRLHELVVSGFKNIEGLTWVELKSSGSHSIDLDQLDKKAVNRLKEIKLDDLEHLFSLRFSGKERLWGIRDGNVLQVLWWDPQHKVCPAPKKHT